jgi:GDPmannose 4,6-dehydratase
LVDLAFRHVGVDWKPHVHHDSRLLRPAEVDHLVGDATRARKVLGWEPTITFPELVAMMVDAELERLRPARESSRRGAPRLLRPVDSGRR